MIMYIADFMGRPIVPHNKVATLLVRTLTAKNSFSSKMSRSVHEVQIHDHRFLTESPPMIRLSINRLVPAILTTLSLILMSCGGSTDDTHSSQLSGIYDEKILLRLSEDPQNLDMYRLEVCIADDKAPHEPSCVGAIRSQNGEHVLLSKALIQSIELSDNELETIKNTHSEYQNYLASLTAAPDLHKLYTIGGGVLIGGGAGVGYYKLVSEPNIKKLAELRGQFQKASKELALAKAVPPDVLAELEVTEAGHIPQLQRLSHKTLHHYLSVDSTEQARYVREILDQALEASVPTHSASTLSDPKWLAGRNHIYSQKFIDFVSQVQPEFDSAKKVHYALETPQFYQPEIAYIYREWIAKGYAPEQIIDEKFFEPLMKFSKMESMIYHTVQNIGLSHLTPSWIRHQSVVHYPFHVNSFAKSLSKGETRVLMSAREFFMAGGHSPTAQQSLNWIANYDRLVQVFPSLSFKQTAQGISDDLSSEMANLKLLKNSGDNRQALISTLESRFKKLKRELSTTNIRLLAKNIIGAFVLIAVGSVGLNALISWQGKDYEVHFAAAQKIIRKYTDLEIALQNGLSASDLDRVNSVPEVLEALSVWISVFPDLHDKISADPHSICIPQKTGLTEPFFKVSCQLLSDAI